MKILFISSARHPDYQSDMVFHGGRSLFGADFVDANKLWYMYANEFVSQWEDRICKVYGYDRPHFGRGFTMCGTLGDMAVDRLEIVEKIRSKHFDYIIYGSIRRCSDYMDEVVKAYPLDRVMLIDGEDDQSIDWNLLTAGFHLFKRELVENPTRLLHPINFCILESKIIPSVPVKTKDWATVIPGDASTYVFNDEATYYADYQSSMFAVTHKKGGWEALRHYEVLMNGCMPFFDDLKSCPRYTMMDFPKAIVEKYTANVRAGVVDEFEYANDIAKLLDHTRKHLTTTAVVRKMFEQI